MAGNGDLPGRAAEELGADDFLHEVGIDRTGLKEMDAVLEAPAIVFEACELFLRHGEVGLGVRESEKAARTPNGIVTKIGNRRCTDRRYDKGTEKTRHAVTDSHRENESQWDSARQGKLREVR